MDHKTKQQELDVAKWLESERQGRDVCGELEYCAACDKNAEYPCARAAEMMGEKAAPKKKAAKKAAPAKAKAAKAAPKAKAEAAPAKVETAAPAKAKGGKKAAKK